MIAKLLKYEVQQYIKDHQYDDPFLLSLKAKKGGDFPWEAAIEQIHSLQKAKGKLPTWAAAKDIIWPAPLSVEQASSEITARYKAGQITGKSIVDLTGGMGVDTSFFADNMQEVYYVEVNEKLATLAGHNFEALGKSNIFVYNQSAEDFLTASKKQFDVLYLDPSRRDKSRKVFMIQDCAPNLYEIIPRSLEKAKKVLVKLSPMVDLSLLIRDFNPSKIWVISVKNEVKEVLCLIDEIKSPTLISAVDLFEDGKCALFEFEPGDEATAQNEYALPLKYIYEPSAAILKAGAFKLVGKRYGLKKLHVSTHLYTSDELLLDFPGRTFLWKAQIHQDKKEIARLIPDKKANVLTRNYPLSPDQLKKKLDMKDGGENYLIGTTLMDRQKVLLWCERV